MKYFTGSEGAASQAGLENSKAVDWNDYNYPPCSCIQMFHYSPEETPEMYRRKVLLLKINHIAIIVALFLNVLTNIIGAAQGYCFCYRRVESGGIRVGISFFILLIWLPISFYLFILPYQIMMGGDGSAFVFYALSLVAVVWFFIWSIADFADANGFVEVKENFDNDRGGAGFFGLVTAILMLLISLLALANAVLFYKR